MIIETGAPRVAGSPIALVADLCFRPGLPSWLVFLGWGNETWGPFSLGICRERTGQGSTLRVRHMGAGARRKNNSPPARAFGPSAAHYRIPRGPNVGDANPTGEKPTCPQVLWSPRLGPNNNSCVLPSPGDPRHCRPSFCLGDAAGSRKNFRPFCRQPRKVWRAGTVGGEGCSSLRQTPKKNWRHVLSSGDENPGPLGFPAICFPDRGGGRDLPGARGGGFLLSFSVQAMSCPEWLWRPEKAFLKTQYQGRRGNRRLGSDRPRL